MKYWWILFSLFLFGCNEEVHEIPDINQAVSLISQENKPNFDVGYVDLNSDGFDDAIVMLKGMNWCGSGGCTVLIFQNTGSDFTFISKSTVTGLPIRIAETKTGGWNDIIVWSKGKGSVLMRFDGDSYPSNPSVQSVVSEEQELSSKIILE
ncbi:hypothetical protein GNP81_05560 [Aliivibrio fischeri]|uniref:hypothetical protein n=1 Tax=Aliivibrio fischeri TaxID=668 RepID=UPI0012D98BEB|nr:hypothetical protein [Aliivibrio fischeri]MUK63086.1 hypothetical protein [Aliivibrio fischeri]MUL20297.1 hypothetical protein [Aliivibrio fischeri]MUL24072.1 hypothetical protein [Aliivibrio fischeri]